MSGRTVHVVSLPYISPAWVLFFIFLVLKLTGGVGWSWLWVLSPLWIPLALLGLIYLALGLLSIPGWRRRRRYRRRRRPL